MKSSHFYLLFCLLLISFGLAAQQNVGIGTTTPAASAMLDVQSTDKGMLVPRMTTAQRTAIASPANGLLVFDTTTGGFWFFTGTTWTPIAGTGTAYTAGTGIAIAGNVITNTGDVSNTNEIQQLSVSGNQLTLNNGGNTVTLPTGTTYTAGAGISLAGNTVTNTGDTNTADDLTTASTAGGDVTGVFSNMQIAAGAVGNAEIADLSITENKITSLMAGPGQVLTADGMGSAIWAAPTSGSGIPNMIQDADGNTKIQVEESPNEDIIRFDLGGTESLVLQKNAGGSPRLGFPDILNNTFVGTNVGASTTTGNNNTAVGQNALTNNTTGDNNTALGKFSLQFNTSGRFNTASGRNALSSNISGNRNTASGWLALQSNTDGNDNTASGVQALYSNTTGYSNIAIGKDALFSNTDQSNLVAVGDSALYNNGAGASAFEHAKYNTAIGSKALFSNTIGYENTVSGAVALYKNTTGSGNTANGTFALSFNTEGSYNTAIGHRAMNFGVIGNNNTAIGSGALNSNGGDGNTACGGYALSANMTGNYNTALGLSAGPVPSNLNKTTAIGYNAKVVCNNCMVLGGTGADEVSVGIGTALPAPYRLAVVHGGYGLKIQNQNLPNDSWELYQHDNTNLYLYTPAGTVGNFNYASGVYSATSDRRLKDNILPMAAVLPSLMKLQAKSYTYKADPKQQSNLGFIAQEVEPLFPELVTPPTKDGERETPYTMNYAGFGVLAVKAVQEQQTEIEAQAAKIASLESELAAIKTALAKAGIKLD